ncbi:hypothetical protein H8E88_04840 [candidate division KSB1 bacterium]|nr:hypothetical protein [candidate division KSB1 bacterium]
MLTKKMFLLIILILSISLTATAEEQQWNKVDANGELARKIFIHCRDFVRGWLGHANPQTGLIPRNLTRDPYWNARDAAADNYPFMVLTCSFVDREMYNGRMKQMLETEKKLTSRVGALPDDFLFETQTFRNHEYKMASLIFGASEYVKDGLMPLTEWLGPSPWQDRMIELVDGILDNAAIETPVGILPAIDHEVGGELMQVLSRLYWKTGKERYKEFALRYGDYFLFHALPTDREKLSLDDHGCEVIGGLSEVYVIAAEKDQKRYRKYKRPMYKMLDRILEVGRNENGLFHMLIDPINGTVLREELTDNWGYDYNAYLTVAAVDNFKPYLDAVKFALENVHKHTGYPWEGDIADGYADSIESGLNLLNRIPIESGFRWVEHETLHMLKKQGDDGVVAGWHGDGNYARTAILVALWKSLGCKIEPWRADVSLGAEMVENEIWLSVRSNWPWKGRVIFDKPRHRENFNLPMDYARLNQFPEWFTVDLETKYKVSISQMGEDKNISTSGKKLLEGLEIQLKGTAVDSGKDSIVRVKVVSFE